MQSKYHNPSRVELDTRATENFAADSDDLKANDVCAAIGMPEHDFVFFNNGMCTKFDVSMNPIETASTDKFFPNLKSKLALLSAARVDPVTELAFFYFRDGSVQVFDTVEKETLGEFLMGKNDWEVPVKYLRRAKPVTKRIKSPNVELVNWCFEHGMTRLLCKPETKIIAVEEATEFGDQLMPPVGASVNADFKNAHRTMLTIRRFAKHGSYVPLESLTVHGSKPVSDQFLAEMDVPSLHSLAIHCPISKQQLTKIRMRGIENFSISHVTDELLKTVTEHFPHLLSLSIDANQLSEGAFDSLATHETLTTLDIKGNFREEDLKQFRSENPDIKVIANENEE